MNTLKLPVLVLRAPGTNRGRSAARAVQLAGGRPELVTTKALIHGDVRLDDYRMLVLPGGFSYGDDLGAGRAWAALLRAHVSTQLQAFVDSGRPVLGICNGFQALIHLGLVGDDLGERGATLTDNARGHFECRWVTLNAAPESRCVFTADLEPIECPVAHGEGRVVFSNPATHERFSAAGRIALRYAPSPSSDGYPGNPNGSTDHIAGLCNAAGNVLGLMPHPEDHVTATQHPRRHREAARGLGLALFEAGLRYAARL